MVLLRCRKLNCQGEISMIDIKQSSFIINSYVY